MEWDPALKLHSFMVCTYRSQLRLFRNQKEQQRISVLNLIKEAHGGINNASKTIATASCMTKEIGTNSEDHTLIAASTNES